MNSEQELQREKKGHSEDDYDPKQEEKRWGQEMYSDEDAERRLDPFVRVEVEKLEIPEYTIQKRMEELKPTSQFKDNDEKLRGEAIQSLRGDMLDRALDILLDVDRLPDQILDFLADDNLTAANQDEIKKAVMVCLKSSRVLQFIMMGV